MHNMENIALQSLLILYIFILREEKVTIFAKISAQKCSLFPRVIQIHTKFANFARLYFPYYALFRHQTWQFY